AKWLYRWLHPDLGIHLGKYMSLNNKTISGDEDAKFLGEDNEWLVQYAKRKLKTKQYDYFVFRHRHLPIEIALGQGATYLNLDEWVTHYTYGVFDGKGLELKTFEQDKSD